jgi:purine-binding chemotaxis protein CheW
MNMTTSASVVARHETPRGIAQAGGEFLSFRLGSREFGIGITNVQEIRSYEQPTRIAGAPAFVKGRVNLRGAMVPIVDLRLRLGCETAEYSALTVVVMLNLKGRVVGAVVDAVCDVLELSNEAVQPAPKIDPALDTGLVIGIGNVRNGSQQRQLILMDVQALVADDEGVLIAS